MRELFAIVNSWEQLNIFAKNSMEEHGIPFCVFTVYLMAKEDILRLGKLIDEEDKYLRSPKNCHP